jgi:hypothetical protein
LENQLNTLISLYEEEKGRLETLIKACLLDEEYLLAHYHRNALYRLNGRLQTSQNIQDSRYDAKQYQLRKIDFLEKQLADGEDTIDNYHSTELERAKEALESLQQKPPGRTGGNTSSLFHDIIIKLLNRKVMDVKLILKKEGNFFFAFTYSNRALKVILPDVRRHLKQFALHEEKLLAFKKLGFYPAASGNKLVLTIVGDKEDILNRLEIIMSKVVFELFYFKEFKNQSYIHYTERAGR